MEAKSCKYWNKAENKSAKKWLAKIASPKLKKTQNNKTGCRKEAFFFSIFIEIKDIEQLRNQVASYVNN